MSWLRKDKTPSSGAPMGGSVKSEDKPSGGELNLEVGTEVWVAEAGFRGSGYGREMYPGVVKDIATNTYVVEVTFKAEYQSRPDLTKIYYVEPQYVVERTS